MSFILLSSLLSLTYSETTHKWDYDDYNNNISHWADTWPECGGEHQSPIEITTAEATLNNTCNTPLLLQYTCDQDQHFAIRNSGHSVQVIPLEIQYEGGSEISGIEILHHTNDTSIRLKNPFYNTYTSTVNSEYCFDSLHFHWGETNEYGSEHPINGEDSPLELHLVHYSCDYDTLSSATKAYADGNTPTEDHNILSVIAVLFEIGEANPVLDYILNDMIIEGIQMYNTEGYINLLSFYYTQFNLNGLLPENKEMFAYEGSLTTPPCYESVRWLVMKEKLSVSVEQMVRFRMLLSSTDLDDKMEPNWRPLQELNDRVVYTCQDMIDAEIVDKLLEDDGDYGDGDDGDGDGDGIMLEIEGEHADWLWAVIGVLIVVTLYLCYLVNCTSSKVKHHGDKDNKDKEHMVESRTLGQLQQVSFGYEDDESVLFVESA